jgi:predicted aldo/keto reductase-like oxidoreductase
MEPLRGGSIINNMPNEAKVVLDKYPEKRSLLNWCFRWLYNMPEVSVILSGTSTIKQVEENIKTFEESKPNCMSDNDMELIHTVQKIYESKKNIGCTGCKYCMPCPQGINIPDIFKFYNHYQIFDKPMNDKLTYAFTAGVNADRCIDCGNCKQYCPQQLEIPELIKKVNKELMEK